MGARTSLSTKANPPKTEASEVSPLKSTPDLIYMLEALVVSVSKGEGLNRYVVAYAKDVHTKYPASGDTENRVYKAS